MRTERVTRSQFAVLKFEDSVEAHAVLRFAEYLHVQEST